MVPQALRAVALVMLLGGCTAACQVQSIHLAADHGDLAQVRSLLDGDPSLLNATDNAGWTPLHFAASSGRQEVAGLLLERGADVNARVKAGGGTPLHAAVSNRQPRMVATLLAGGAGANTLDDNALTPLHRAALAGDREVVELLLANGGNAHAWSSTGMTPIDQAAQSGHDALASLMKARSGTWLPMEDGFSGTCRWSQGETSALSFGCRDGAYRFTLKRAGPVQVAENFGWEATAVSVEVEAGVVSGRGTDPAGGANLGIGCMSSRSSGYAGGVGTNGAWAIMRIDRALTPLANALPGTLTTRSGTNRLRLVCSRLDDATTVVKFAVGGEEVGVVRDTHRAERFNGVLLYADTFPGVVTFERFDARRPADQPDTRR